MWRGKIVILNWNLEHLFNLKFAAKDLERNAKKSEKAEKEEKTKLKKVRARTLFNLHVIKLFHLQ